ncbi:MAG: hypothetical protein E7634_07875 [Ruminococcaceae bacterium]|nr:hypothetical protein [Oscillospiraceae bacterium]
MRARKITALLLAIAMLILPLAVTSCGKDDGPGGGDEIQQDENKMLSPAFGGDHLKFDNEDFVVLTRGDRTVGQAFNVVDLVVEENMGDVTIVDAVQRRNDLIEQNFEVKIKRYNIGSSNNGDANLEVTNAIEKQDYTFDAFMLTVEHGLGQALKGTMVDFSNADYIDLSSPWWDQGITNNLKLFGGAYIALGDINTVDNDGTWCVLFNKELLGAYGTTDQNMYDMVKSGIGVTGGWTTDELIRLAKSSYKEDSNTREKWLPDYSGAGTYGLFLQSEVATAIMQASGNTPTVASDSMAGIVSNIKSQEFQDAIDATFAFMGNRDSADWYLNMDTITYADDKYQTVARAGFMANKATFFICHIGSINLIRDMKADFGIIPLPKLSENQENYGNTIQYNTSQCYVVPYRMDDYLNEKSCYVLEALAYYSSTEFDETGCLSYAYYTLCLQAKGTRDDDAWDMLDIIFDNRVFDLACALNISNVNTIIRACTTGAECNWVSQRDANLSNLDTEIGVKLEILAKG